MRRSKRTVMDSRIHYVAGESAISGTGGRFIHRLEVPVTHDRIVLISAKIPRTSYMITTLDSPICDGKDGVNPINSYTIPAGNYTGATLAAAINLSGTIICNYDPVTLKFDFQNFFGVFARPLIRVQTLKLARILGLPVVGLTFPHWYNITEWEEISVGQFRAPGIANLSYASSVWICTNAVVGFSQQTFGSVLSHFFIDDIYAIGTGPLFASWTNPAPGDVPRMLNLPVLKRAFETVPPTATYEVEFSVFDDGGSPMDFNGLMPQFVIKTFASTDIYDLLLRYFHTQIAFERERRLRDAADRAPAGVPPR